MAGNTRGKLKEHLEGIHRNLDWCLHHIEQSLGLIAVQIKEQNAMQGKALTDEELMVLLKDHYLYKGFYALGEGMRPMDELAKAVYEAL